MADRDRRAYRGTTAVAAVLLLVAAGAAIAPVARAAGYPPLPLADDRGFVEGLRGASLAPGGAGAISLVLHDPLASALQSLVLTVGVYAFSPFPGNGTGPVDLGAAPVLSNASASGLQVAVFVPGLAANASQAVDVPVAVAASTPSGTFAVRLALGFRSNGAAYNLSSRGWFSAATWAAGTEGPNGSLAVNLTRLGVSGILPETTVYVATNGFADLLWVVFGVGAVVVAAGAYLYFRRSKSSSGARPSRDEPTHAPRAFGTRRSRDGD